MLAAGAALALSIVTAAGQAAAEGELHVYNWGDYINPAVLDKFSEVHDVKVTLDTYGSNEEMLAKIQAGATGYDIVFPSVHMHDIMATLDLLWQSDINQHPDFKNIDPQFLRAKSDPEGAWCLPYAYGSVGIFYNKTKVPEIKSWADFFAVPEKTGEKIALLDDMREVIGVGLIMGGHSVNSRDADELKQAQEFILAQKPNVSTFSYDTPPMVISGEIAAAHMFVGAQHLGEGQSGGAGLRHPGGRGDDVPGGHLHPEVGAQQGERQEVPGVLPTAGDRGAERQPADERHAEHPGARAHPRLHQGRPQHHRAGRRDDAAADVRGSRRRPEAVRPDLDAHPHRGVTLPRPLLLLAAGHA